MPVLKLNENGGYGFQLRTLNGIIHPHSGCNGLILEENGTPITRPGMCAINLGLYLSSSGRLRHFIPSVESYYEVDEGALSVDFDEMDAWNIHTVLTYDFQADDCIDVTFDFKFSRGCGGFEAVVSSYFDEQCAPLLNVGQEWIRPHFQPNEQLFFTRDDEASVLMQDGRWDWLQDYGRCANDDGRKYTLPVIVNRSERTKFALIQMIELMRCPAISVNMFPNGQAFSLIGENVSSGEQISVRSRLLYRDAANLDAVTEWYDAWDTAR